VGYVLAPPHLTCAIRKVHDFLTVGAPAPLQHACVAALNMPPAYYEELVRMYDKKRHMLYNALTTSGFKCKLPQGAYYILADISAFDLGDDVTFAHYLASEIGVAAAPGSSFYKNPEMGAGTVRFTFYKSDETLLEVVSILENL